MINSLLKHRIWTLLLVAGLSLAGILSTARPRALQRALANRPLGAKSWQNDGDGLPGPELPRAFILWDEIEEAEQFGGAETVCWSESFFSLSPRHLSRFSISSRLLDTQIDPPLFITFQTLVI